LHEVKASNLLKKQLVEYIKSGQIVIHSNTKTNNIISKDNKVVSISVENNGISSEIKTSGVFIFVGLKPNTMYLKDSGVKLDKKGFVITDNKLQTNIAGIFASGDVRSGATMQVACAVGEGATAAINISEYLSE
jgi:thioredoxin reductase (NADPH)